MNNREKEREELLAVGGFDSDDDDGLWYDDEGPRGACTRCGGEGYTECSDPLECTRPHLGGSYGMDSGEVCQCGACGGSGLAKDQTVW